MLRKLMPRCFSRNYAKARKSCVHSALANPPDDPIRHAVYREEHGLRPGGYGVLVAKELVDELIYDEKGNDVLLIKYLDNADGKKLAIGKA